MADVIVTLKVMPSSPDIDLDGLQEKVNKAIKEYGADLGKVEIEPVAFGLKALNFVFVMSESLGDTETLEKTIAEITEVNSVEVTDVRRAIG
jgi:elongation factor 1-beta